MLLFVLEDEKAADFAAPPMANFGARITNASLSALAAQQAVIATTANNIANLNTPGYARRTLNLEPRAARALSSGIDIGDGVEVGSLVRQADRYLEGVLREGIADKFTEQVKNEFLTRLEPLFSLAGDRSTIGDALGAFFSAARDLGTDPASLELRTSFVTKASDLVNTIRSTYDTLASLQDEADQRIETELQTINSLTSDIATLNSLIVNAEASGGVAAGDRDKREALMQQLAEKISYNVTEVSDGSVNISLANGFALVSANDHRDLEISASPSFVPGVLPPSLSGSVLRYIVFDYDSSSSGAAHIDLTTTIASGGGTVAGLLNIRGVAAVTDTNAFQASGTLVDLASRVEAITRQLLTSVNTTYLGPDRDGVTAGLQPSAYDLDGNVPAVFGLFDFTYGGAKDADSDGIPEAADLNTIGLANYSSLLTLTSTDPRDVAAGRDQNTATTTLETAPGDASNIDAIADLEGTSYAFAVGSFSQTGTFGQIYNQTVSHLGALKSSSDLNQRVTEANLTALQNRRDEISGVNLDEEFTVLIRAQRSFQAAARLIKIADEILQQIVQII